MSVHLFPFKRRRNEDEKKMKSVLIYVCVPARTEQTKYSKTKLSEAETLMCIIYIQGHPHDTNIDSTYIVYLYQLHHRHKHIVMCISVYVFGYGANTTDWALLTLRVVL